MLVDKMNSLLNIFNGTDLLIAAHCENHETIKKNTEKYVKEYIEKYPHQYYHVHHETLLMGYHAKIRSIAACYESSELLYAWHALQMHACISCISLQPENFHCLTMISR